MNIKNKITSVKDIIKCFKMSFFVSPLYSMIKLLLSLFEALNPVLTAVLWKYIIDLLILPVENNVKPLILSVVSYCVILLIGAMLKYWHDYVDKIYYLELEAYTEKSGIETCSHFDLSYFDDSEKQSQNKELSKAYKSSVEISWGLINIFSTFVSFIISFILVCKYNWIICLITVLLVVPKYFYSLHSTEVNRNFNINIAEEQRLMNFYGSAMEKGDILLDIKINNSANYFYNRYLELSTKINKKISQHKMKLQLASLFFDAISHISFIIVIMSTMIDASIGAISIGSIQYNWNIVDNLKKQSLSIVNSIARIIGKKKSISLLASFINNGTTIELSKGGEYFQEFTTIEFQHVYFAYPNTDTLVLNDCSFIIRAGEKIGLVGLNGSGKTTIIKLLMRFYDPISGVILVNGKDIKEYNINSLRLLFSTMFQENPPYIFMSLREGIALSNYSEKGNNELLDAACTRSGFLSVIREKKANYDMILNDPRCIHIDNSFNLSGGEWQKLALSRTYFRNAQFFIFDEPSASLDVFAEQKIFDDFLSLSQQKTAILISHRLSNMRICDKIFVLEGGKIVEQGTHEELLLLSGRYSYLYNIQAQRY